MAKSRCWKAVSGAPGLRALSIAVAVAAVAGAFEGRSAAAPAAKAGAMEQAAQVLRLNREAMELYESLEFELARKSLEEALEVGAKAGLGEHAVLARTHANLGIVFAVGLKDSGKAVSHFRQALEIKPDYKLAKDVTTPEVNTLFNQAIRDFRNASSTRAAPAAKAEAPAKAEPAANGEPKSRDDAIDALLANAGKPRPTAVPAAAGAAAAAAPEPAASRETAPPPRGETRAKGSLAAVGGGALKCPSAGEVEAGDDITLRCVTSGDLRPASVILFYKRSGREDFIAVPMKSKAAATDERKASWTARIPGDEVAGSWLPFYFEARDGRGAALALAGRDDSPNIITIRGGSDEDAGGKPKRRARDEDEGASAQADSSDEEADDTDNPLARIESEKRREAALARRFFVGIAIGAGGGYAGGAGVEAYKQYVRGFSPGFAPQGLGHGLPEIGYFVTPDFALALQSRHQYIPRYNDYNATGANSVLARALFFFGKGAGRFYAAAAAGGGEGVRMVVVADTSTGGKIKDTVRGGPVLAGGGLGFNYALGDVVNWMIETGVLAGLPTFSAAFDVNTGLRFRF